MSELECATEYWLFYCIVGNFHGYNVSENGQNLILIFIVGESGTHSLLVR